MLYRRHQKTVRHETCQTLKVKRRWESLRVGDDLAFWPWVPLVEFVYFDGEEVVLVAFADRPLPDGREGLCYGICYSTKNLSTISRCASIALMRRQRVSEKMRNDGRKGGEAAGRLHTALVIMVVNTILVSTHPLTIIA